MKRQWGHALKEAVDARERLYLPNALTEAVDTKEWLVFKDMLLNLRGI